MARTRKVEDKMAGVVEIRMVNPKRTGTITVRDYTDETGTLREFKDEYGNQRVKKYTKPLTVLRMDSKTDRLEYLHVKDHPIYVKGSHPLLRIIDVVQEAEERTSNREAAIDAMIEARKLSGEKLINFARVLGINTNNVLESVLKDRLYDYAEKQPEGFLTALNDPNRLFKEILHKGKVKNVFTHKNNVWKYRETLMGANIDEAILWIKDNEDLLPSIRKELSSVKE
jgi:hypothetical protein